MFPLVISDFTKFIKSYYKISTNILKCNTFNVYITVLLKMIKSAYIINPLETHKPTKREINENV